MVDHHPFLLTILDLRHHHLLTRLTSKKVCEIIEHAGKRIKHIHLWNHESPRAEKRSSWNLWLIFSSLLQVGPSIELFVLYGHQSSMIRDCVSSRALLQLHPKCVEFATCSCHNFDLNDLKQQVDGQKQVLTPVSTTHDNEITSPGIRVKLTGAHFGPFTCHSAKRSGTGWYRICPVCLQQWCVQCASYLWEESNEWKNHLVACSCWYCTERDISLFKTPAKYSCTTHCPAHHLALSK